MQSKLTSALLKLYKFPAWILIKVHTFIKNCLSLLPFKNKPMEIKASENIFKKDVKLEVKKVDFTSGCIVAKIEELNKKQDEILNRKVVNADKLNAIVQF